MTPRQAPDRAFAESAARLAGQAGLLFGWSPQLFWEATPAELAVLASALRGDAGAEPLDAADAAALIERFPDV